MKSASYAEPPSVTVSSVIEPPEMVTFILAPVPVPPITSISKY